MLSGPQHDELLSALYEQTVKELEFLEEEIENISESIPDSVDEENEQAELLMRLEWGIQALEIRKEMLELTLDSDSDPVSFAEFMSKFTGDSDE